MGGGGQTYDWQGTRKETDPGDEAKTILAKYNSAADLEKLKTDNDRWWEKYWMKSHIDIGDDLLHRYYYGSLYYMGCTSRDNTLPTGLYGIWTTTDSAMWNGDYHMNYNYIAPFYGMYSSNRYEQAKSLKNPLMDYMENGKKNAKEDLEKIYNNYINGGSYAGNFGGGWSVYSDGYDEGSFEGRPDLKDGIDDAVLYPVSLGPWGSSPWHPNGGYLMQMYNAGFPAMALTAYYNYTKDADYLREIQFYLEANANFFEKWCEKEELDDGKYRYNIWSGAHENTFDMNSGTVIGTVKNILECLIDGNEAGDIQSDPSKLAIWKDMYDNFAEYPVDESCAKYDFHKPYIPLSETGIKFKADEANVGLEFIAPGEQMGFDSDPALREAARNSTELKAIGNPNIWSQINETAKVYLTSIRSGMDPE